MLEELPFVDYVIARQNVLFPRNAIINFPPCFIPAVRVFCSFSESVRDGNNNSAVLFFCRFTAEITLE